MIVIKLGGSVITEKAKYRTFRRKICERLIRELKYCPYPYILIHGAGSFGHIKVDEYKLSEGVADSSSRYKEGIAIVSKDVRELNCKILSTMINVGIMPFSLPPKEILKMENGAVKEFNKRPFDDVFELDMIPVSFGDLVPDCRKVISICSGDVIMLEISKHFKVEKMIFVTNVDGVWGKDGKLMKEISPGRIDEIAEIKYRGKDVTGDMKKKLMCAFKIAERVIDVIILNGNIAGRLEECIKGRDIICTRVISND